MREIRRVAVEQIHIDELLGEHLVAGIDALTQIRECTLGGFTQRLVRQRIA